MKRKKRQTTDGTDVFVGGLPRWIKVLTFFSIVAAVVGSTTAYVANDRGTKWERNAREVSASLLESQKQLSESIVRVKELELSLSASESDVKSLENRLTTLSDEKAQARNQAAQASLSAAALYDLTRSASSVTALMGQCITYQSRWTQVLSDMLSGYSYDKSAAERFLYQLSETCNSALSSAQKLREIVESIQ